MNDISVKSKYVIDLEEVLSNRILDYLRRRYIGCEVETPEWESLVTDVVRDKRGIWFASDYGYVFLWSESAEENYKIVNRNAYGLDEA